MKVKSDHFTIPGCPHRKLKERFIGPFCITSVKSPVSFVLDLPDHLAPKSSAFRVNLLCPYYVSNKLRFPSENLPPALPEIEELVVDNILSVDLEKQGNTLIFKICWAALYDSEDCDS